MSISLVDKVRDSLPDGLAEQGVEGCSMEDLQYLAERQQVACLPSVYCELMLFMGKRGIDWLLYSDATVKQLSRGELKQEVCTELDYEGVAYPPDMFIFSDHDGSVDAFFRTKGCEDDPAVFLIGYGDFFWKRANNLSEFVLQRLASERRTFEERWAMIRQSAYRYDPEQDGFYPFVPAERT